MGLIDWIILASIVLGMVLAVVVILRSDSQGCDGVCTCCKRRCNRMKR